MKTQHIGLTTTIMAAMAISALHFVSFDGKVATAGSKAAGICEADSDAGEACPVNINGVLLVTAGGAIAVGQEVEVGAEGKAIALASGKPNGYALDEAKNDGEIIRIVRGI